MPTGCPLVRREDTGFRHEFPRISEGCRDWIDWISHERDIDIQSAFHGAEKRIGKYKVDGFANAKVFEFYGDYWHAHPDKFPDENALHQSRKHKDGAPITIKEIRDYDHQHVQFLLEQGYEVEIIWEKD